MPGLQKARFVLALLMCNMEAACGIQLCTAIEALASMEAIQALS